MKEIEALRERGFTFHVEDDTIRYKSKNPAPPREAAALLAEIKRRKAEALRYLRVAWPPESTDYEIRFRSGAPRLFPFLGKEVSTPHGPGILWRVGSLTVQVVLTKNPKVAVEFAWYDVLPGAGHKARRTVPRSTAIDPANVPGGGPATRVPRSDAVKAQRPASNI
jgi:hypothetical protein